MKEKQRRDIRLTILWSFLLLTTVLYFNREQLIEALSKKKIDVTFVKKEPVKKNTSQV